MPPTVEIRSPFPEYAWPQVWSWTRQMASRLEDDWSPKTLEAFVEYSVGLAARAKTWGVWRDAELGGLLALEPVNPVSALAHVVFKRSFWGFETTRAAVNAALAEAFGSSELLSIGGMVFEDNHAVRSWYGKMGFQQEGKLRSRTLRGGKPVNVIVCGLTKEQWNGNHGGTRSAAGREEQLIEQPHHDQHRSAELHAGADEPADGSRLDARHSAE